MSDIGTGQRKQLKFIFFTFFFFLPHHTKINQSSNVSDVVMTEDTEKKGERAQSCNWISGVEQLQIYVGSKKSDVPSYNECVFIVQLWQKGIWQRAYAVMFAVCLPIIILQFYELNWFIEFKLLSFMNRMGKRWTMLTMLLYNRW